MRTQVVTALVAAAVGALAVLAFRAPNVRETRVGDETQQPDRRQLRPDAPPPPLRGGDDAVLERLRRIEALLDRIIARSDQVTPTSTNPGTIAATGTPPPIEPLMADSSGNLLRTYWLSQIDELEAQLRRVQAQGSGASDPVLESRKIALAATRRAVESASDLEALKRLTTSEHKSVLVLPK